MHALNFQLKGILAGKKNGFATATIGVHSDIR